MLTQQSLCLLWLLQQCCTNPAIASLQTGVDAAGLPQYKGELVVSMKYIPSSKHTGAGNGRKGECWSSYSSV